MVSCLSCSCVRAIVSTLTVEEVNSDRRALARRVTEVARQDLARYALLLILPLIWFLLHISALGWGLVFSP